MKVHNIGQHKSIKSFVEDKLHRFQNSDSSFKAMFELMFSEKENVLFEKSQGYKIVKTTYGTAYDHILSAAAALKTILKDAKPDAVVGIYMTNCVEWIEVFWAVLAAGFRPLLMNLRLDKEMLEEALASTEAVAVISQGEVFSVPVIAEEDLQAKAPAEGEDLTGPFGTEIFVMSSGTSNHIKICAYSGEEFRYLIEDSYHIIKTCKPMQKHYEGELKLLTFLPFYHVFGLIAVYIWFAFFSRTFVQLNDMAPLTIVNTIRRHKVTHIFAVPMFWEKVYEQAVKTIDERGEETRLKFQKGLRISGKIGDIPGIGKLFRKKAFAEVRRNLFGESICFMITGGSDINPEVMEFFNGIGYHLANGYGMTEIGITSVELSKKSKLRNACYVGGPFSSVEYRIAEDGELLVRGKATAKYILEDGSKKEQGEWFHTRDLAQEHKGHYLIKGRMDDLVISPSGENLNPNAIEPKFSLEHVQNVCLIGEKNGDRILPVLICSVKRHLPGEILSDLDEKMKQRLLELQLANQIQKLVYTDDSLLEENDFKLKRGSIAEKYARGAYHLLVPGEITDSESVTDEEMLAGIRELFATALGKKQEEISNHTDFFLDCGGTSLDYFALCAELENRFGVALGVSQGEELRCIRDFYEYIEERRDS